MDNVLANLEAELVVEEGNRFLIYDDATGKPIVKGTTVVGNVSAGIGLNLMIPFAAEELQFMEDFRVERGLKLLAAYAWFTCQDPVRQVALADLAYNLGVAGLLHWPDFLACMGRRDYPGALAQVVSDAKWVAEVGPTRSTRIENMISTGQWPSDVRGEQQ